MNEPRIECFDCMSAASGAHHGFSETCLDCCARAASRSPHFDRVRKLGRLDSGYRALLEQFKLTHERVRLAASNDALPRAIEHKPLHGGYPEAVK